MGPLQRFLNAGDPLADDVVSAFGQMPSGRGRRYLLQALSEGIDMVPDAPEPLHALFKQLDEVPFWVDWSTLDRGGQLVRRTGLLGALTLSCYALPLAYSSGAGIKPLVFSGRLVNRAKRRLSETAHFNLEVTAPGGLRRHASGFSTIVRVRLMHAQVRYLLRRSPRWNADAWGAPINQLDMAGTNLFFSVLLIEGLRKLGFHFSKDEVNDVIQLWRYCGYLIGIHPDLLCANESDGHRLADILKTTRFTPDADSRKLVKALMETALPDLIFPGVDGDATRRAEHATNFGYGLSFCLLGDARARQLDYPRTFWRFGAPALLRLMVWPTDLLRRLIPGGTTFVVEKSTRMLQQSTEQALSGQPATYDMPERLSNKSSSADERESK